MVNKLKMSVIGVCMLVVPLSAQAAVVESSNVDIGGASYETFLDGTTGKIWLDLDDFWDLTSTYSSITALLSGSGFHIANLTELQALQASMPASFASFSGEVAIVGGNYSNPTYDPSVLGRNIMWGIYDDEDGDIDTIRYSWRFELSSSWEYGDANLTSDAWINQINPTFNDLGVWVVQDVVVPVPAAAWLFGSGLLGLVAVARRRA